MYNKEVNFICIDVGSYKTAVIAARITFENEFTIKYSKLHASEGFGRSGIENFSQTDTFFSKILHEIDKNIGCPVDTVSVIFSGPKIQSHYETKHTEIDGSVIKKSDTVNQFNLNDRSVDFRVDEHDSLQNPIGMSGAILTAKFHMISSRSSSKYCRMFCYM